MKKDKKRGIIIILVVVILILAVGGIIFLRKEKNPNDEVNEPAISNPEPVDMNQILKEINEINAKFTKENLTEDGSFTEEDNICKQYLVDNPIYMMEDIQKVYMNPFADVAPFNIVTSYYNDGAEVIRLYVCLPKDCELATITEFEVTSDGEYQKEVKLNSNIEATLIKTENGWKFEKPIMICK